MNAFAGVKRKESQISLSKTSHREKIDTDIIDIPHTKSAEENTDISDISEISGDGGTSPKKQQNPSGGLRLEMF